MQKHLADLTGLLYAEVGLSQIIPAFQLAPTEAEPQIFWRFVVLSTPSVNGSVESLSPKLPIMISRA
jgi:hypothetical protein